MNERCCKRLGVRRLFQAFVSTWFCALWLLICACIMQRASTTTIKTTSALLRTTQSLPGPTVGRVEIRAYVLASVLFVALRPPVAVDWSCPQVVYKYNCSRT